MSRKGITVVCAVFNEEKRIERFIRSFSIFDEIIIINKNSTDKTLLIAKSMGVTVITIPYTESTIDIYKAFIDIAAYNWIFLATASDVVHPELAKSLYRKILSKKFNERYNNIKYPCISYILGISGRNTSLGLSYRNTIGRKDSLYLQDSVHNEIYFKNNKTYQYKPDSNRAVFHLAHDSVDVLYERWLRYSKLELQKKYSYQELLYSIFAEIHKGIKNKFWKRGWFGLGSMLLFINYRILIYIRYMENDMGNIEKKYNHIADKLISANECRQR